MNDPRIEDLMLAEIVELRGSKAALQVEIDRLRALNDDQFKEIERLEAERHTTKQLLEDVLEKYGVGSRTPHYGVGRGGLKE